MTLFYGYKLNKCWPSQVCISRGTCYRLLQQMKRRSDRNVHDDPLPRKHRLPDQQTSNVIFFKDSEDQEPPVTQQHLIHPWLKQSTRKINDPLLRMHNQIIDLTRYLEPTEEEHQMRTDAFLFVKGLVQNGIEGVVVESFGSFPTRMYLPNSDIDIAVIKEDGDEKVLLEQIYRILAAHPQQFQQINKIKSAKVPIIKFVKTKEKIHMDISVNKLDGLVQLNEVKKALGIYPQLKYLVFVNKCMLKQREMSETYVGGIGSYLLFCMVLCFVREMRKEHKNYSLGQYLLKFLQFYGMNQWGQKRIFMRTGQILNRPFQEKTSFSLMSPQDDLNDIGSQAFNIRQVFGVYRNRYKLITNYNFKRKESIMKYLVNPSDQVFSFLKQGDR